VRQTDGAAPVGEVLPVLLLAKSDLGAQRFG
jgi:hypothetical protein